MRPQEFRDYEVAMAQELCPPFSAVGLGGSTGAVQADESSDLDFFFLAPTADFLSLVEEFPRMVRHAELPVAVRRRGFHAEFGYMFTYVFADRCHVDYTLNCSGTLARTPMAAKTRVIKDLTGEFTDYHEQMRALARAFPPDEALEAAAAEFLVEIVRIEAYVRRAELLSVLHRFERLRLVLLGLERYLRGLGPYTPHDADKWVARDLPPGVLGTVAATFGGFDWAGTGAAFEVLQENVRCRIAELGRGEAPGEAYWELVDEVLADVRAAVRRNAERSAQGH